MLEILSASIGMGLVVGLIFTEFFGIACGGLVVPGYMALYLTKPIPFALTIAVALMAFFLVRVLSMFMIVYGRRRIALMILIGYLIGSILKENNLLFVDHSTYIIGFIVPGLIAAWMDRQGIWQTLASMTTVSIIVRLILILIFDMEKFT